MQQFSCLGPEAAEKSCKIISPGAMVRVATIHLPDHSELEIPKYVQIKENMNNDINWNEIFVGCVTLELCLHAHII